MMTPHPVAVLVGSLRKDGYSNRLATALMRAAPETLSCRIVGIGDLPLYNEDLAGNPPLAWEVFRHAVRSASALLVVTPEYNRSFPGALKNALDVGSRPYGQNVFDGMPSAVVSHSPGPLGGFGANHALRQTFVTLNQPTLQQPEAYISNVGALFDDDGALIDAATETFLAGFMTAFGRWVAQNTVQDGAKMAS
jgi:chromate reductase, NAD(P)H dehydrogenase (quinone)